MWSSICTFWHSLFRPAALPPTQSRETPPAPEMEAPHQILKHLHAKRDHLRKTISSYLEFGFDDLARQAQDEMVALDRRILEVRLMHHAYP